MQLTIDTMDHILAKVSSFFEIKAEISLQIGKIFKKKSVTYKWWGGEEERENLSTFYLNLKRSFRREDRNLNIK